MVISKNFPHVFPVVTYVTPFSLDPAVQLAVLLDNILLGFSVNGWVVPKSSSRARWIAYVLSTLCRKHVDVMVLSLKTLCDHSMSLAGALHLCAYLIRQGQEAGFARRAAIALLLLAA